MPKRAFILYSLVSILLVLSFACSTNTPVSGPVDSSATNRSFVPTPVPTLTFDEEKARASQIPYNDLFRNNEAHEGKHVWYQGKVIQVVERRNDEYQLRVNVTKGEYSWNDTVFLHYFGPRVLEDDIIEFVGTVEELLTYEAIFGQEITVPAIRVTAHKLVAESGGDIPIEPPTISAMLATPTVTLPTPTTIQQSGKSTPIPTMEATPLPTALLVSEPTPAAIPASTATPTAIPTVTPTSTPNPTPTPLPPGLTLEMPVQAPGVLKSANGVEVVVTSITEDAWPAIRAANQFNDPPEEGKRFYMVTVAVAYPEGGASINVGESEFRLIGHNRVVYVPYDHSCGVIPDELSAELFAGGKTEGNICFQIPIGESGLVLIHQSGFGFESRRFLSLDPAQLASIEVLDVKPPDPNSADLELPHGLALGNPVVSGGVLKSANGVEVVVTSITEDAWPAIRAANQFNDPPEEGKRFYMISVAVAYPAGSTSINVRESDFRLIGDARIVYVPHGDSCGVIPDELSAELFAGGKAEGNICFQIPGNESGLILIHQSGYGAEGRRFLSLDPSRVATIDLLNVQPVAPDPTDLEMPKGLAIGNPIESGGVLKSANGVEVVVTSITEDAWPAIRAANQFNDPPEEGKRFYMISVAVAYPAGSTSINVRESDFRLIGDARIVYVPHGDSCGVIPDELSAELFAGGKAEGNICFQIPGNESGLILIHQSGYGTEGRRFLAID